LDVESDWTVADALNKLCELHPDLKPLIFQNDRLADHFVVLVEGINIWSDQGLNSKVRQNSTLSIVYPIEGG